LRNGLYCLVPGHWRPDNKASKDKDILVCTSTYQYILVCTCTYSYILVHISTYQYVTVHTDIYKIQPSIDQYILVCTSTYRYRRVHTVSALLKKKANRTRTGNLVHTMHRFLPLRYGLHTSMPVKLSGPVSVFIIEFCQTPWQCTWRLMTNRRRWSRRAAAPGHDIPRPSLNVDLVEA